MNVEPPAWWIFREGTWDRDIFDCVVRDNEYRLPESLPSSCVVIDVGSHIGSFGHACISRGARFVMSYEADFDNWKLSTENLLPYGAQKAICYRFAVWRSDVPFQQLFLSSSQNSQNTGGGDVVFHCEGQSVPSRRIDLCIQDALWFGRSSRVNLMKLDCEYSEWPILLTSTQLGLVDEVIGEFHEIGGEYNPGLIPTNCRVNGEKEYTVDLLESFFHQKGYSFIYKRSNWPKGIPSHMGFFWAKKHAR